MQLLQACKEDLLKLDEEDENAEEGLSHEQRYFCQCLQSGVLSLKQLSKLSSVFVLQGILTEILSNLMCNKRHPPWRGSVHSYQVWPTLQPSESGLEEDGCYPEQQGTADSATVSSKMLYAYRCQSLFSYSTQPDLTV